MRHSSQRFPDARCYDSNGDLTAPRWFWLLMVWQLFPWWLTAGGVAAERDLTDTLFPSQTLLILALLCGVPVFLMLFIYPLRGQTTGLAQLAAVLLWSGVMAATLLAAFILLTGPSAGEGLYGCVLCVHLACMVLLTFTPRLWMVFFPGYRRNTPVGRPDA